MIQFSYDYILPDAVATRYPHSRHASAEERNDAQILRSAVELGEARFLAVLAAWSPSRIAHALQILENSGPQYEEHRASVLIIGALAGELARLKANVAAMATPHPADVADDGTTEAHGTAPL